ncbi:FYVE-domain-containing protein [Polyplosphaeria fusca]|uniref:FYVE-domain-containing protein n=1 Tax=Polyplosphaeria fusca TaxID=682080 RepID=A0A9P4R2J0_9PLEO|nr:FYVE-domain-containing protein [Polyplosphaeria fusca]
MAADFSTATIVSQPAPYQHHAYKTSSQHTPTGLATSTSSDSSPTSPRTTVHPLHVPQIRPQKNPIYVPAALRRTEKPARQSPPKHDSVVEIPDGTWSAGVGLGRAMGDGTQSPLARIATEDLNSIYSGTPLSPVAGPITRNHWQPDSSTSVCSADSCETQFGFFTRRHHCRKCGAIFCWQHSQHQVRLTEFAIFHPEGDLQRACDGCYNQYRLWEQVRTSRSNSEDSGRTPAMQIDTPIAKRPEPNRVGSLATSFQGAWNWSTF